MKYYGSAKKELLRNKQTKAAYDELGSEFELIQMIVKERIRQGLTQKELARQIGTKQSAISRLERGTANPSLAFLRKLTKALGGRLHISITT